MTEEKKESQAKQAGSKSVKKSSISKIQVVAPKDSANGAQVLRFIRDDQRKNPIDISAGQILTVGDSNDADITKQEADRLLNYSRWEVKEVTD